MIDRNGAAQKSRSVFVAADIFSRACRTSLSSSRFVRKLFAILLLCCLLFLIAGYQVLYLYRIAEAKAQMKETLRQTPSSAVLQLRFSESEFTALEWEEAQEFRYKGEMYDVLSLRHQNGATVIACLPDKLETSLVDAFLKTQKQTPENSPTQTILKLLTTGFLPSQMVSIAVPEKDQRKIQSSILVFLPDVPRALLTPPPQDC